MNSPRGWDSSYNPNPLFDHYVKKRKYVPGDDDYKPFNGRKNLLKELETNQEFKWFWDDLYEERHKYTYELDNLLNPRKRFEPDMVFEAYEKHLEEKGFAKLSSDEIRSLEVEASFEAPPEYQTWIRDWAHHNGCKDYALSYDAPRLELEHHDRPLKLEDLPNGVFLRILKHFDIFDIIKVTLVCKKWKSLVYKNQSELKRAEYSLASFLMRQEKYKDYFKGRDVFLYERYKWFTFRMIKWYLTLFRNVKTAVLYHGLEPPDLAALVNKCPTMKGLVLYEYESLMTINQNKKYMEPSWNSFANLELLICCNGGDEYYGFTMKMFQSRSYNLRALHSRTLSWTRGEKGLVFQTNGVLSNLVALELTACGRKVLKEMAISCQLKLKYLKLELYHDSSWRPENLKGEYRQQDCLHELLTKTSELEVLVLPDRTCTVNRDTLQLITNLGLDLKFGIFWTDTLTTKPTAANRLSRINIIDCETLISFREMLLSKDQNRVLSDIVFIEEDPDMRKNFIAMELGFTFSSTPEFSKSTVLRLKSAFKDPILREFLSLRY